MPVSPFRVRTTGLHRLAVRRAKGAAIEGVVRGPDGDPVLGGVVTVAPMQSGAPSGIVAWTSTRHDGSFSVPGLDVGLHRLAVAVAGCAREVREIDLRTETRHVDVVLPTAARIEVWPDDGRTPPSGVEVVLRGVGETPVEREAALDGHGRSQPWRQEDHLPPGRYTLTLVRDGVEEVFRREVVLHEGETTVVAVPAD